jgi:hypothetical protein
MTLDDRISALVPVEPSDEQLVALRAEIEELSDEELAAAYVSTLARYQALATVVGERERR